jgi:hypothetical protein
MAGLAKAYSKSALERRRFYVDYSCWLEETETLTEFNVVVQPFTRDYPLTTYGAYSDPTNKRIVMYIGGGKPGTTYTVSLISKTNQGQTKQDNIGMKVTAS